jgi:hypothetical protein
MCRNLAGTMFEMFLTLVWLAFFILIIVIGLERRLVSHSDTAVPILYNGMAVQPAVAPDSPPHTFR